MSIVTVAVAPHDAAPAGNATVKVGGGPAVLYDEDDAPLGSNIVAYTGGRITFRVDAGNVQVRYPNHLGSGFSSVAVTAAASSGSSLPPSIENAVGQETDERVEGDDDLQAQVSLQAQRYAQLVAGAPGLIDTFLEVAEALNNDPSFGASVMTALAGKATPGDIATAIAGLSLGNIVTHSAAEFGRIDVSGRLQTGQLATVASRAPLAPSTDAHASRVINDLTLWHTWLAGKPGAITEFGFPCRGKGVAEWGALAEAWFQVLDGFTDQVWATQWGIEFGDADVPFDEAYPGTVFTANPYNRMAVYSHVPAGGSLLGPVGRLSLAASILEHHFSSKQTNRYGVVINAGVNGYIGTTMGTDAQTPGRSMTYNPGPTHDMAAGLGGGLTCQQAEYNYGTLVAPTGTMTTPEFLASRGVGVVRIPIRWERIQPVLGAALDTTELARLDAAVAAYNAAGVKVILDIHNWGYYFLDDNEGSTAKTLGSASVTQAHFVDLWTRMATHFVGMAGVVGYELMNEPAGVASAASWQTISQAAFNAIKAIDTATTILVATGGGGDYSNIRTVATSHPSGPWITSDTHNQARYVSHHYWDYATASPTYDATYAATYQANVTASETAGYVQTRSRDGNFYFPTVRSAFALTGRRRAATYWNTPPGVLNATALTVLPGFCYFVPILVERPITIDLAAIGWVAHPTAGRIRFGLYAEGGNQGRPDGAPLADSGLVTAALSNGTQQAALAKALTQLGKYWLAILVCSDITGSPTVGSYTPPNDMLTASIAGANVCYQSGLTTTLPTLSADPSFIGSAQWPLVSHRVSAVT